VIRALLYFLAEGIECRPKTVAIHFELCAIQLGNPTSEEFCDGVIAKTGGGKADSSFFTGSSDSSGWVCGKGRVLRVLNPVDQGSMELLKVAIILSLVVQLEGVLNRVGCFSCLFRSGQIQAGGDSKQSLGVACPELSNLGDVRINYRQCSGILPSGQGRVGFAFQKGIENLDAFLGAIHVGKALGYEGFCAGKVGCDLQASLVSAYCFLQSALETQTVRKVVLGLKKEGLQSQSSAAAGLGGFEVHLALINRTHQ